MVNRDAILKKFWEKFLLPFDKGGYLKKEFDSRCWTAGQTVLTEDKSWQTFKKDLLQAIDWDGLVEQVFIEELGRMADTLHDANKTQQQQQQQASQ